MKLKKMLWSLLIICMAVIISGIAYNKVYAEDTYKFNVKKSAYTINGKQSRNAYYMTLKSATDNKSYNNLYCFNAGASLNNNTVLNRVIDNYKIGSSETYINTYNDVFGGQAVNRTGLTKEQNYAAVLWVLDNMVVKSGSNEYNTYMMENLVNALGLPTYYVSVNDLKELYSIHDSSNNQHLYEVIQQAVIWHFTNNKVDVNNMISLTGGNLTGAQKDKIKKLYDLFVAKAEIAAKNNYVSPNIDGYTASNLRLDAQNAEINFDNRKIGPFNLNNYNDVAKIFFGKNNINVFYNSGLRLESNQWEFEKTGSQFYIKLSDGVNINNLKSVKVEVKNVKVLGTTSSMMYLFGDRINTQPVVNVHKQLSNFNAAVEVKAPEAPLVFDLHLSKNIEQVYKPEYTEQGEITGYTQRYLETDGIIANRKIDRVGNLAVGATTDTYLTNKYPVSVSIGDIVKYKITIHNEGEIAGYASQIADYIGNNLEVINPLDNEYTSLGETVDYRWEKDEILGASIGNGSLVEGYVTDYLSKEVNEDNIINPYEKATDTIDSKEVYIYCKIADTAPLGRTLKNVAEIIKYGYYEGSEFVDAKTDGIDRDSKQNTIAGMITAGNFGVWKGEESNPRPLDLVAFTPGNMEVYFKRPMPGIEDDDDFENVRVKDFDLALTKQITEVKYETGDTDNPYNVVYNEKRLNHVNYEKLNTLDSDNNVITTLEYNLNKTPVRVKKGAIITYKITVYNESYLSGYAEEITDYLPEGLELISYSNGDGSVNDTYGWKEDISNSSIIKTTYGDDVLLDTFDGRSVLLECRVTNDANGILTNVAEISKYKSKDGSTITYADKQGVDRDSIQNTLLLNKTAAELISEYEDKVVGIENKEFIDKAVYNYEDDDDYEQLEVEEQEFDLALRKFISDIKREGVSLNIEDRTPNVDSSELLVSTTARYEHKKEYVDVMPEDLVIYTIRIYNEGSITGYATEITDYLPQGLEFIEIAPESSDYEIVSQNKIGTGESYTGITELKIKYNGSTKIEIEDLTQFQEVKVICKVVEDIKDEQGNVTGNIGAGFLLINRAEITGYKAFNASNEDITEDTQDRDSVPNTLLNNTSTADDKANKLAISSTSNDNYYYNYYNGISDANVGYYKGIEGNGKKDFASQSNIAYETKYHQDDTDFETIRINKFDLALRKFISEVSRNGQNVIIDNREPDLSNPISAYQLLINNTARYAHTKDPVIVHNEDIVTYTIRVYNEGTIDGYAREITDYLPEGLEFVEYTPGDGSINDIYGWFVDTNNSKILKTRVLEDEKIMASNGVIGYLRYSSEALSEAEQFWIDVKVQCRVTATGNTGKNVLVNVSEITEYGYGDPFRYADSVDNADMDSIQNNVFVKETPIIDIETYYARYANEVEGSSPTGYFAGIEDDDDFENIKIAIPKFDLSLEKFITGVDDVKIEDREPEFRTTQTGEYVYVPLYDDLEPVLVGPTQVVTYTLRIYNEGEQDGYAAEIMDDMPEGLEFVPYTLGDGSINDTYKWVMYKELKDGETSDGEIREYNGKTYIVTTDIEEAEFIRTDYLSKESGEIMMTENDSENPNLLKAFNKMGMTEPDYRDIKIQFKVTHIAESVEDAEKVIINYAQITEDTDKNGDPVDDDDSTPNVWVEGEDDQDKEKIRVKYFDLALIKWVTQAHVIENGVETVYPGNDETDIPEPDLKVDLKKSKLDEVVVKFKYKIKITNEGEMEGHAKEIADYIPAGLRFVETDETNIEYGWKEEEGRVVTRYLEDILLKPEESATVEIMLTWINGADNLGRKINVAEISEDSTEYDTPDVDIPDIDSTPDNQIPEEDDIDDAPVLLTIQTGKNSIQTTYIALGISIIGLITTGVVLIRKYVLL